jgi:dihydrodipicolinate synthase/N-acetylneuraminate lyase
LFQVCSIKEATGSVDFASEISSVCDIDIFSGDDGLSKVSIFSSVGLT